MTGEGGDEGEDLTGKVAMIGDVAYEKLEDAIAAAAAGETIVMLADAELDVLVLNSGVKLDLNGFELSADYVVAFDGNAIVDSAPGVGLVKSAYVSLAKNNDFDLVQIGCEGRKNLLFWRIDGRVLISFMQKVA